MFVIYGTAINIKMDLDKKILLNKILPRFNYSDTNGIRLFGGSCGLLGQVKNKKGLRRAHA